MNNIFVAAPSYKHAELAKKYIGVPRDSQYVAEAWHLRGHRDYTLYVVSLGYRPNDGWHPFQSPANYDRILDIMLEAEFVKAEVKQVVLP